MGIVIPVLLHIIFKWLSHLALLYNAQLFALLRTSYLRSSTLYFCDGRFLN